MIFCGLSLKTKCGTPQSTGLEGEHALDVPTHGHQVPFTFDILKSSQQTLPISHYRFDDAKYRLRCLFTQRVQLSALRSLQPMRHLLQRGRRISGDLGAALMMPCASHRDQGLDLGRSASLDVS